MSQRIEDYALIGDTHTAALVGRDGSLDWLCVPRFDSAACFAALLGAPDHGRWLLAPKAGGPATRRSYQKGTLVLVQEWDTPGGTVRISDFMPPRHHRPRVYRRVEGVRGHVEMATELIIRLEYGSQIPWVVQKGNGIRAVAGPDAIEVDSPLSPAWRTHAPRGGVRRRRGRALRFPPALGPVLRGGGPRGRQRRRPGRNAGLLGGVVGRLVQVHGEWEGKVQTSLVALKALTYAPTGGIVAAPTTSLPEALGGTRNWDYRYCWVRDAALTIDGLVEAGCREEAEAWLWWLVRAVAGNPGQMQIMYGVAGERRLPELEIDWLPGYEGSSPVRVGNAASVQFQLDVYGELMLAIDVARSQGIAAADAIWDLQRALLDFVEVHWDQADQGIWELRGPPQPLVYSRVMAWVAMDRGVKAIERDGLDGPVERWREVRDLIHAQVCSRGFDESWVPSPRPTVRPNWTPAS